MRALRKHSAELIRYGSTGYYDDDGNWVQGNEPEPVVIKCTIQPDFVGTKQVDLPDGIREKDCRILYTATELISASENTGNVADVLRFEGKDFEVHNWKKWSGLGRINAYEVLVIRKDKLQ